MRSFAKLSTAAAVLGLLAVGGAEADAQERAARRARIVNPFAVSRVSRIRADRLGLPSLRTTPFSLDAIDAEPVSIEPVSEEVAAPAPVASSSRPMFRPRVRSPFRPPPRPPF